MISGEMPEWLRPWSPFGAGGLALAALIAKLILFPSQKKKDEAEARAKEAEARNLYVATGETMFVRVKAELGRVDAQLVEQRKLTEEQVARGERQLEAQRQQFETQIASQRARFEEELEALRSCKDVLADEAGSLKAENERLRQALAAKGVS